MKKLLTLVFLAALAISACKQGDKEDASVKASAGSWTLAGKTYTVAYTVKTTTQSSNPQTMYIFADAVITGANSTANTLNVSFKTAPTASGTFQLVGPGQATAAGQCEISAGGPAGAYAFIGPNSVNVNVEVTGGKIKVTLPEITMKSTTSQPDAKLTATIQEM